MDRNSLEHLADRLKAVVRGDFCEAEVLVRKVLDSRSSTLWRSEIAEHSLYISLWDYVTRALDNEDYLLAKKEEVRALETEMAGHVLGYRLHMGWLCRSESSPNSFPVIHEFLPS
ncbi:hypothetical protein [Kushneria indalinina]|uniref:Uncharacterized protein n=1 Tax=Kushneria indalinina DSM 14324 TaxID=1122140 RepID=A0A3D9DRF6_9GAMM|nr:hypothetical protein [Kushneria indalinina]REC93303.1 hypothetical protein C8D72_3459 [Kushneria indalinina DSM 14324]